MAMLLAVGLIATVLQLGPSTLAPTPARASGEEDPVPVLEAWTETTQVYANPDGTSTATIASEPIQAPDETSETGWSPVDETLSDVGPAVEPAAVAADVSFSDGGTEPIASVSDGEVGPDGTVYIYEPRTEGGTGSAGALLALNPDREYGGTNAFDNLVPVKRTVHQGQFNSWWRNYRSPKG